MTRPPIVAPAITDLGFSSGTIIGAHGYRLVKRIGRGGTAEVWEALNPTTDKRVALKFLRADKLINPRARERFEREAKHTPEHPYVVAIHHVEPWHNDERFMVMELLTGRTLAEALHQSGSFSVERAANIVFQVASALGAAHRVDVVHCDVTPRNIFLIDRNDGRDHVKLIDFGLSERMVRHDIVGPEHTDTRRGTAGTMGYMAPEQALQRPITPATDVHALGIVLSECLTGKGLWPQNTKPHAQPFDIATYLAAHEEMRHAASSLPQTIPADLQSLIQRSISPNPAHRVSLNEFFDTLAAHASIVVPPIADERVPVNELNGQGPAPTTTLSLDSDVANTQRSIPAPQSPPPNQTRTRARVATFIVALFGVLSIWFTMLPEPRQHQMTTLSSQLVASLKHLTISAIPSSAPTASADHPISETNLVPQAASPEGARRESPSMSMLTTQSTKDAATASSAPQRFGPAKPSITQTTPATNAGIAVPRSEKPLQPSPTKSESVESSWTNPAQVFDRPIRRDGAP